MAIDLSKEGRVGPLELIRPNKTSRDVDLSRPEQDTSRGGGFVPPPERPSPYALLAATATAGLNAANAAKSLSEAELNREKQRRATGEHLGATNAATDVIPYMLSQYAENPDTNPYLQHLGDPVAMKAVTDGLVEEATKQAFEGVPAADDNVRRGFAEMLRAQAAPKLIDLATRYNIDTTTKLAASDISSIEMRLGSGLDASSAMESYRSRAKSLNVPEPAIEVALQEATLRGRSQYRTAQRQAEQEKREYEVATINALKENSIAIAAAAATVEEKRSLYSAYVTDLGLGNLPPEVVMPTLEFLSTQINRGVADAERASGETFRTEFSGPLEAAVLEAANRGDFGEAENIRNSVLGAMSELLKSKDPLAAERLKDARNTLSNMDSHINRLNGILENRMSAALQEAEWTYPPGQMPPNDPTLLLMAGEYEKLTPDQKGSMGKLKTYMDRLLKPDTESGGSGGSTNVKKWSRSLFDKTLNDIKDFSGPQTPEARTAMIFGAGQDFMAKLTGGGARPNEIAEALSDLITDQNFNDPDYRTLLASGIIQLSKSSFAPALRDAANRLGSTDKGRQLTMLSYMINGNDISGTPDQLSEIQAVLAAPPSAFDTSDGNMARLLNEKVTDSEASLKETFFDSPLLSPNRLERYGILTGFDQNPFSQDEPLAVGGDMSKIQDLWRTRIAVGLSSEGLSLADAIARADKMTDSVVARQGTIIETMDGPILKIAPRVDAFERKGYQNFPKNPENHRALTRLAVWNAQLLGDTRIRTENTVKAMTEDGAEQWAMKTGNEVSDQWSAGSIPYEWVDTRNGQVTRLDVPMKWEYYTTLQKHALEVTGVDFSKKIPDIMDFANQLNARRSVRSMGNFQRATIGLPTLLKGREDSSLDEALKSLAELYEDQPLLTKKKTVSGQFVTTSRPGPVPDQSPATLERPLNR